MRTLFLDIDGVLNRIGRADRRVRKIYFADCPDPRYRAAIYLEEKQVERFAAFFQDADAAFGPFQIVVSSSWRDFFHPGHEQPLFHFLAAATGISLDRFVGATPRGPFPDRTFQIRSCLQDRGLDLDQTLIVDDQDRIFDGNDILFTRLIKTDGIQGFSTRDHDRALMLLRNRLGEERPKFKADQIWLVQRAGILACHGILTPAEVLKIGQNQNLSKARIAFLIKAAEGIVPQLAAIADLVSQAD